MTVEHGKKPPAFSLPRSDGSLWKSADAKGTNLNLEKQDLDPATAMPFVKLNRQGSLRFIVFKKQGEAWTRGGDLRDLAKIEVLK